tara:strand:- start:1584 stop:1787 length:204 start_codon:yes stop_codon:yes gene_type:complete
MNVTKCPECKVDMWIPNEDKYTADVLCINDKCKYHLLTTELWKPESQDYRSAKTYVEQITKHRRFGL